MLSRYMARMDLGGRQERISEIQDAVVRMTRIIDKVLLTSRLELQQWDRQSETFDLSAWCWEFLADNFGDADQKKRITVHLLEIPVKVAMDRRVLEIALQNLLSNALKYSLPASPVDLELCGNTTGRITFVVRDRGIGIPESDLPKVMASFYRGGNVGDVPGTGLGLAIVKGCADLCGGTLEIESSSDVGTCVRLLLPDWLQSRSLQEGVSAAKAEVIEA